MRSTNADKPQAGLANSGEAPLYVTDDELHLLVSPKMGRVRFRAAIRLAEAQGFPPIDTVWGGRYWPKVKAWLDNRNRLNEHDAAPIAQDGQENFDASPRRHSRSQTKPQRTAILDGVPGCERSPGVPRPFHSVAGGR
jgi:hypothetical protein